MSRFLTDTRGMDSAKQSIVANTARYNCPCGRWIILTRSHDRGHPISCECGRRHYWSVTGDVIMEAGRVMPALCLDLDGTVRRSRSGATFIAGPDDVELFPGVADRLRRWRDAGWLIFGVSNQAGVAHQLKTWLQVDAEMKATVIASGTPNPWHAIKCCYHDAAGSLEPYNHRSLLRKPNYGMLALLEVEAFDAGFIVEWDRSIFVGDRDEDRKCAEAAGLTFIAADEWRLNGEP